MATRLITYVFLAFVLVSANMTAAQERDFHLQPTSPCIGAGDPATAPEYDIEGNPRSKIAPTVGAYEYRADTPPPPPPPPPLLVYADLDLYQVGKRSPKLGFTVILTDSNDRLIAGAYVTVELYRSGKLIQVSTLKTLQDGSASAVYGKCLHACYRALITSVVVGSGYQWSGDQEFIEECF